MLCGASVDNLGGDPGSGVTRLSSLVRAVAAVVLGLVYS